MSKDWECHFSRVVQCPTPILLGEGGMRRGLTPFIFELMWLKEVQGLVEKLARKA